jgi:hypothetical protein
LKARNIGGYELTWLTGTRQTAYALYRVGETGEQLFQLAGTQTTFVDTPPGAFNCYALLSFEQDALLAVSDALCGIRGTVLQPAPEIAVRLDQSPTATVSWLPLPGATNHRLFVGQAPERSQLLGPSVLSAVDPTGGQFTCYAVFGVAGSTVGVSHAACVIPGVATAASPARLSQASQDRAKASVRDAVRTLKERGPLRGPRR